MTNEEILWSSSPSGKTWVWYTPTYKLGKWLQANGRIPRPSQPYQTEMMQIKFIDTVEQTVYESIEDDYLHSDLWTEEIRNEVKKLNEELNENERRILK